jgi:hypothetical protein
MAENRTGLRGTPAPNPPVLAAETLRNAAPAVEATPVAKGEERIPLFWRVFGGTLLSIAALVVLTLGQQFHNSLNELRADLEHLNSDLRKDMSRLSETYGDLVKKDEFSARMRSVWDSIKDLQTDKESFTALKERCAIMQARLQADEDNCKDLTRELQQLREARAREEERTELLRELQRLRERLAAMEGRQAASVAPSVHGP